MADASTLRKRPLGCDIVWVLENASIITFFPHYFLHLPSLWSPLLVSEGEATHQPSSIRMEKDPPWEWVGDLLHIKHFVLENLLLVPFLHGYLTVLWGLQSCLIHFKHEYLRSRASTCVSLSSSSSASSYLLAIYRLSRYSCLHLGSLHPRIFVKKEWE